MKIAKLVAGGLLSSCFFSACTSEPEPTNLKNLFADSVKKITAPFQYQKSVEVGPGLTFDVMTWGRGADSVKAYLILRSDSVRKKFASTSGELTGNVHDVWNMDLDTDGNPEIFIQTKGKSEKLNLYVHEYDGSGSSQKLRFPELSDATKKKYRGFDSLYVREGKLIREFPLYKDSDAVNKPTDGRKYIEYGLSGNEFTVQNLNANGEPEKVQAPPPEKKKAVKKTVRKRRSR